MTRRGFRRDERRYANQVRAKLRDARLRSGYTYEQAAKLAGYSSKSGWAMVELGYNIPSTEQMDRMAAALGVKASDVFEEVAEAAGLGRGVMTGV